MTTILHINSSPRGERSLSRRLSADFIAKWKERNSSAEIIVRDVGTNPPPIVTEQWIAAAFTRQEDRTAEDNDELALSDELIAEVDRAQIIIIGAPMHNYGMPAALKSWFDKVIRIGKTFTFDLERGDFPLKPIMSGKTLVVLSARGEFGFGVGGIRENMNHLDTHIATCSHYLGVDESHVISIDYQEFNDDRHQKSIADACAAVPRLVDQLLHVSNMRAAE